MTTLKDLMASDVTDVFLDTDEFAEQVIRYAGGNVNGRAVTLLAVVTWHPTVTDYSSGRATERTGELMVAAGDTWKVTDAVKIGTQMVQVQTIGPEQYGKQTIGFIQRIPETKGWKPLSDGMD